MIVYEDTIENFSNAVVLNSISDIIHDSLREHHLSGGSHSEINSWNNSLQFMKNVLDTPDIPKDCNVAIEYNIPQTSKRVDFMILGKDDNDTDHVIIVELKFNSSASKALEQIKEKKYFDLLSGWQGGVLFAGVSYDTESKKHECKIERFEK